MTGPAESNEGRPAPDVSCVWGEADLSLQFLAGIVDHVADPIFVKDRQFRFVLINRALSEMLGHPREDMLGKTDHDFFPEEEADYFRKKDEELFRTGDRVVIDEESITDAEGRRHVLSTTKVPLRGDTGEVTHLVGIIHDITAIKDMERELRQMNEELQRRNQELEEFAYVASHDLQEPLRAIAGFCQLLQRRYEGELDEKADEFIHYILDGARRMRELIQGLLAYSRLGTRAGDLEPVPLQKALDEALRNLRSAIEEADGTVMAEALPTVRGDRVQLTQLFQNLVGNALKYAGEDPPEIHVTARSENGRWQVSVRDEGIGMEARHQNRIFGIFERLHARDEYEGTGIGLALCKKIVERHGGRIWIESEPGEGTTVHFTLPAATDDPDDGPEHAEPSVAPPILPGRGEP